MSVPSASSIAVEERVPLPGQATAPVAERLWRALHERLTAFVAQRVDEPADVDDIVQTVFLRVHQHAGSVSDDERLLPWLFQVTRNAIADFYRAPGRRREVRLAPDDALDDPSGIAPGEADAGVGDSAAGVPHHALPSAEAEPGAFAELSSCVRPMVEQLPPLYREALTLVEFDGRSQVEAASALGVSVSGMKSRVQRGRAELRQLLLQCCEISRSATGGVLDFAPRAASGCDDGCGR
jgi:RNA polymerase sigma-70 factor (ECF subfamily)